MDQRTERFLKGIEAEHGPQIAEVVRRFITGEIGYMRRPTRHVKRGWVVGETDKPRVRERNQ